MSAALHVTPDCDGCTGDRCPTGCPVLEGERRAADADADAERELLEALKKKSTEVQDLMVALRSLRFVHSETSEALELVLGRLGAASVEDAVLRIAELLAIADNTRPCACRERA